MYKNILILSSDITGHGHKSITESLLEQFNNYSDTQVRVVDGFSLSGNLGLNIGKMYGSITRASKDAWKRIWDITLKKPSLFIEFTELTMHERFTKLMHEMRPDSIVVTHPNYNAAVTNILSKINHNVPLFAIVADPVTITPLWCNPHATFTICPTPEAKEVCLKYGVPEDRIRIFGFPARQRFTSHMSKLIESGITAQQLEYIPRYPMRFMIMSGGEGSGNMSRLARILLKNFDCHVRLVCGRNKILKQALEHTLAEKYKDRVEILGFTEHIDKLMLDSDIIFMRASPNTLMESIMCNIPVVITGALPGQEEGNPAYVQKHGLGAVCTDPKKLKETVSDMLADNCQKLISIKKSQLQYANPYSARDIVNFIMDQP